MNRGPVARPFLRPLVPLYRLALALRELRLSRGWEPVRRLDWPVVSIGNISAGGAGKTPLTIALAQALTRRGVGVDVLSRGYGRRSKIAAQVDPQGSYEEFGDEPLLIARAAGVPVFVAGQRFEAGRLAETCAVDGFERARLQSCQTEAQKSSGALAPAGFALHLLDDGFQHRQLDCDVDIVLLSGADLRDSLLPAGNLREPVEALLRASIAAIPEEELETESELRALGFQGSVWRVWRRMEVPKIEGPVIAFCGIARPEQFFSGLEKAGLEMAVRKSYADHYRYTAADVLRLASAAVAARATLVTTEKDAVRFAPFFSLLPESVELRTAGLVSEIEDSVVEELLQRVSTRS